MDVWLQVVEGGWTPVWVREAVYHYRHHASSFLSGANELNQTKAALAILSHHRPRISETIGVDAYLEHHVMPFLRGAIRAGRFRDARPLLTPTTVRLLAGYYLRRIKR